jgi:superfamily I DNA/RNA helicase
VTAKMKRRQFMALLACADQARKLPFGDPSALLAQPIRRRLALAPASLSRPSFDYRGCRLGKTNTLAHAYVEAKQQQHVLDYDDLLLYWAQMMQEPSMHLLSYCASGERYIRWSYFMIRARLQQ